MMKIAIILSAVLVIATAQLSPKLRIQQQQLQEEQPIHVPELIRSIARSQLPTEEELEQNSNAKYEFSSNIEDHINDLSQQRTEVRDGLAVKGMYSYSDGYFKRTVHYEADERGYRVIGEEVVPLDGPKVDLDGVASVDATAHGTQVKYSVQSVGGAVEDDEE